MSLISSESPPDSRMTGRSFKRQKAKKRLYDRNYGVFVTQCMDYFLPIVRREAPRN